MVPLQVIVEAFHEKLRTAGVPQVEVQTLCWGRFAGSRHEELEPLPVLLTNGRPEPFASEAVSGVLQEQRSQRLRVVLKAKVLSPGMSSSTTVYCSTPGSPSIIVGIIIDLLGCAAPPTPFGVIILQ